MLDLFRRPGKRLTNDQIYDKVCVNCNKKVGEHYSVDCDSEGTTRFKGKTSSDTRIVYEFFGRW